MCLPERRGVALELPELLLEAGALLIDCVLLLCRGVGRLARGFGCGLLILKVVDQLLNRTVCRIKRLQLAVADRGGVALELKQRVLDADALLGEGRLRLCLGTCRGGPLLRLPPADPGSA